MHPDAAQLEDRQPHYARAYRLAGASSRPVRGSHALRSGVRSEPYVSLAEKSTRIRLSLYDWRARLLFQEFGREAEPLCDLRHSSFVTELLSEAFNRFPRVQLSRAY